MEVGVEAEAGAAAAADAERVALVVDEEGLLARRPLVLHRVGVEAEQVGLARARVRAGLDGDLRGDERADDLREREVVGVTTSQNNSGEEDKPLREPRGCG